VWNEASKLPRNIKRFFMLILDSVSFYISFILSLYYVNDSLLVLQNSSIFFFVLLWASSALVFVKLGLYRAVLRYASTETVWAVSLGCILSAAIYISLATILSYQIEHISVLIYLALCLAFTGGIRVISRAVFSRLHLTVKEIVIVYGAGSAGCQLVKYLENGDEYKVIALVDDDLSKIGTNVVGVKVYSSDSIEKLIKDEEVSKILLAMPSVVAKQKKKILDKLESFPVEVKTVPPLTEIIDRSHSGFELKDIDVEDLLGRQSVTPNHELMRTNISNKVVMVTGAGGSIGSELCRQILKLSPQKIVLFELTEYALYSIDKELKELAVNNALSVEIIPLLGSIQHKKRLVTIMRTFSVDTVYHAAAYKHVPLVENNVAEGVRNNIFGTLFAAQAAIETKVSNFILVSTDKAVRPTNVMGASKRMAELTLQALQNEQSETCFSMVRFGNVLGSSGSVVPLFKRQIKQGGPITLTHPEITRFFMTIPEAAQLVIQAGSMAKGGDVFVLDMGQPVKIKDLATKMVHLSGMEVRDDNNTGDKTIEIVCTGLRPGEKLYEELLIGENVLGTEHQQIMSALEVFLDWSELKVLIDRLDVATHEYDQQAIRDILLEAPTGFTPTDGICDLVWSIKNKKTDLTLVS